MSEPESSEQELKWIRGAKTPSTRGFLQCPLLRVKAEVSPMPPHTKNFIIRRIENEV